MTKLKTDDFPCKTRKFKLGAVAADGLGHLLQKTFFVFIKWESLAMSDGANRTNFWQI
jgi:hypothetical protein